MGRASTIVWGINQSGRTLIAILVIMFLTPRLWRGVRSVRPEPVPPQILRLDPNNAPRSLLLALPAIGPSRAAGIIEARDIAPFETVDEIDDRVKGIGPATLGAIEPYLRIDSGSTQTE